MIDKIWAGTCIVCNVLDSIIGIAKAPLLGVVVFAIVAVTFFVFLYVSIWNGRRFAYGIAAIISGLALIYFANSPGYLKQLTGPALLIPYSLYLLFEVVYGGYRFFTVRTASSDVDSVQPN